MWTAPPTFVAGAFLTAAQMNILGGDLSFLAGTQTASVATSQTTGSTSWTDLITPGPAVTVTTGSKALVIMQASLSISVPGDDAFMNCAVSGATTIAAPAAGSSLGNTSSSPISCAAISVIGSLVAGSNTFTAKYEVAGGGTGTWSARNITVVPLP